MTDSANLAEADELILPGGGGAGQKWMCDDIEKSRQTEIELEMWSPYREEEASPAWQEEPRQQNFLQVAPNKNQIFNQRSL